MKEYLWDLCIFSFAHFIYSNEMKIIIAINDANNTEDGEDFFEQITHLSIRTNRMTWNRLIDANIWWDWWKSEEMKGALKKTLQFYDSGFILWLMISIVHTFLDRHADFFYTKIHWTFILTRAKLYLKHDFYEVHSSWMSH